MAKLVLDDVGSTLTNTAATTINNNNTKIEQALENTLSRDGSTPNNMSADIDMDSNDLLNVGTTDTNILKINGENVQAVDLATALKISNNLSELTPTATTARTNIGAASTAQGAKADSALQPSDLSSSAVIGKGMKPKDFTGLVTVDIPDRLFFFHGEGETTGTDVHSFRVDRRADYSGGTSGFENAALVLNNVISASSTLSYEDALLAITDNSSPGPSQNTAGRFVGRKRSTGSTWSLANESEDTTGLADPTSGLVGVEQVVAANGTDSNNNRIGYDSVISRPNSGGVFSGAVAEGGVAFRATNQVADTAANRWKIGFQAISVGTSTGFGVAFDASQATIFTGGAAFRMAGGQKFSLTSNTDRTFRYESGAIRFNNNSVDHFTIADNGDTDQFGVIKVDGIQVVTSRRTGWTAATGTATRTSFDTSTVTTTQLAERVKALIDDLITHGLIGT